MSHKVVVKFGGTSVKNAYAIGEVATIVADNINIRAIIVSAVAGVTNLLLAFCKADTQQRQIIAQQILNLHLELSLDLGLSIEDQIRQKIKTRLTKCTFDKRGIDNILALGEDLSALIVCTYLQSCGINASFIDARSFMITDNHYGKAIPKLESLKAYLFPEGLFITQGFIGATVDNVTTTLGRGGSDYSASLVAEAINAQELIIYTDVPGVYTTDPKLLPGARLIAELTFQEMAEMASFGAKILHPATLEPCARASIPVKVKSTFEPEKAGTLISVKQANNEKLAIKAITARPNQCLVTVKSIKMLNSYGFLANIFTILANHKISIDLITTSEVSVALTVDGSNLGSHSINPFIEDNTLIAELDKYAEIYIEEKLTLIAIIGSGLTTPGAFQTMLRDIDWCPIRLICYGASNSSISILVPEQYADRLVHIFHHHFFGLM